jgi:hypothetical protein
MPLRRGLVARRAAQVTPSTEIPRWLCDVTLVRNLTALDAEYACGERTAKMTLTIHYKHGEARVGQISHEVNLIRLEST